MSRCKRLNWVAIVRGYEEAMENRYEVNSEFANSLCESLHTALSRIAQRNWHDEHYWRQSVHPVSIGTKRIAIRWNAEKCRRITQSPPCSILKQLRRKLSNVPDHPILSQQRIHMINSEIHWSHSTYTTAYEYLVVCAFGKSVASYSLDVQRLTCPSYLNNWTQ